MLDRREFLRSTLHGSAILPLAVSVPWFLTRSLQAAPANDDGRILVVLELSGGNDGLNTVIPFADENYARFRRRLRIPTADVLKLDDQVGFHPALRGMADLLEDGRLAVVQGVGYPNPNRSHFESMAIWHTARHDPRADGGLGWLGRALDQRRPAVPQFADALCIGDVDPPQALVGRQAVQATIRRLDDVTLDPSDLSAAIPAADGSSDDLLQFVRRRTVDARLTAERLSRIADQPDGGVRYPNSDLGRRLQTVARLIRADLEPRVFYTVQPGYDTHIDQLNDHLQLLDELGDALRAFLDDLRDSQLDQRVVVLAFSEFGRRVEENDSEGTDHGTAGPAFLAGAPVVAGLHGRHPSLTDLDAGDLRMEVDFRRIYATLLNDWLGIDSRSSLGGVFEPMALLK